MALILATLKSNLESNWLIPEGGAFPADAEESGEWLSTAVATWFATAQSNGLPCTSAALRRPGLASSLGSAFATVPNTAAGAAAGIIDALVGYVTGQTFGAGPAMGTAAAPLGAVAAVGSLITILSNLELARSARAQQIAAVIQTLALTTTATFPSLPSPTSVT